MTICRHYGNPDLFITFACNPKWPKISRALTMIPGQKPDDRPDIISRIFKMKLDNILSMTKSGKIFGTIIIDLYVIEFQKRGLPHCHFLFQLHHDYKLREPEQIDRFIFAKIPYLGKKKNPLAHHVVADFMMHDPCGYAKTVAPCMKSSSCSKIFPRQFRNETTMDENKIVNYK